MPLIVLPKSCSCRCGPCPPLTPIPRLGLSVFFLSLCEIRVTVNSATVRSQRFRLVISTSDEDDPRGQMLRSL